MNMTKRFFDVFVVLIASPILVILAGCVAVLVGCKLGRPVIFSQPRPGLNSRIFRMHKFRTMVEAFDVSGKPLPDDQRLTPFGSMLRSTSLDELPALWNVLKGEMSLVGPRPLLVEYLPLYSPEQSRRHDIKPGITGWAQVNGRNSIDWEAKFQFDIWYLENQSLKLDIKILLLTLQKAIKREGINSVGQATIAKFTGNK